MIVKDVFVSQMKDPRTVQIPYKEFEIPATATAPARTQPAGSIPYTYDAATLKPGREVQALRAQTLTNDAGEPVVVRIAYREVK